MKRILKRALSIFLVTVMVFGAAPLNGLVGLGLPELDGLSKLTNSISEFFRDFWGKAEAATNVTYYIEVYMMDTNGNYEMCSQTVAEGAIGDSISIVPGTVEGLEYNPELSVLEGVITSDGNATLKIYYKRLSYSITWHNGESEAVDYYLYGEEIVSPPVVEDKEGYNFWGWYYEGEEITFPVIVTDDMRLSGLYLAEGNAPVFVEYYFMGNNSDYIMERFDIYDACIGDYFTYVPDKYEEYEVNLELSSLAGDVRDDGSTVLKVYYDRVVCSVNFYVGGVSYATGNFNFGSEIIFPGVPQLEGYKFLGWSKDGINILTDLGTVQVGENNFYAVLKKDKIIVKDSEYAIFVNNINGKPIEGAKVTWNSNAAMTDKNGMAVFERFTTGQPLITAEKNGYITYTNENTNYSKSSNGYEFITLYEDTTGNKLKLKLVKYSSNEADSWFGDLLNTTKRVSLKKIPEYAIKCVANDPDYAIKYELYQNDNLIATSTDGVFKNLSASNFKKGGGVEIRVYSDNSNYVVTPINLIFEKDKANDGSGFSIGNKIEFTVDDDIPFIGGSTLKMDFPVFPVDISINENDEGETTVHIGVNADIYGAEKDKNSGNWTKEENESFREKQEGKIKDIQKALSTMESWYTRASNPNDKDLKEIKNLCEDVSKPDIPGFNKVSVSFLGYGEGVWNSDSEFSKVTVSAYLVVEATVVDSTYQNFAPLGPFVIPLVFNITVKGEAKAGGEISYEIDTSTFTGDLKLNLSAGLNMFGGVGIGKAVGVGAYGNASLDTEIQLVGTTNTPGLNSVDLTGEAGFKAYFAIWDYEKPWAHRTWNIYSRNTKPKNYAMLYSAGIVSDDDSVYDIRSYSLQNLSYLEGESDWLGLSSRSRMLFTSSVSGSPEAIIPLLTQTYRDSRPMIVSAGDTMVMVYTGSDSSRTAYNHTRIMYSVYNITNNSWSTPKQLDDNNTLDMTPYLYSDGTNIYVVYLDATKVFDSSDDMETIVTSQNISVAKFNFENDDFDEPTVVVAADSKYNSVPVVATVNGEPIVLYQRNASNDVFGTTSDNSIIKVTLDGKKETVASGLNSVVGYAIGDKGIAYIIDSDNVLNTYDDRLLYINGEFVEAGVVSNPQFSNNGKLYWYSNGTVKEYDNGINNIYPEGIIGFTDSFKVLDNKIIYLSSTSADTSDIMQLSFENGLWSEPVQLTEQDKIIDTFSAAEFNGEIITVMTRRNVTVTETEVIDECEIAWSAIEDRYDIIVDYVDYEYDDVIPDSNLNVTAGIVNKGTTEITKVNLKITNSAGDVVYSKNHNVSIMPSEDFNLTATIPIGEIVSFDEYTVTITEIGVDDYDITNNSCVVQIGYTQFDVNAINLRNGDYHSIIVSVENTGYTVSGGILNVYNSFDNENPVCTYKIGELSYGEHEFCRIDVTEDILGGKAGKLYIEFKPDIKQFNIFSNKTESYIEICNHSNVGEWQIKSDATCTRFGEKVKRCAECYVAVEYEEIPMLGHGEAETVTTAATCTEAGKTFEVCSACGEIVSHITETDALGHKAGQWKTLAESSIYFEGYEILCCVNCDEILDEKIVSKKSLYTVKWVVDGEENSQTYENGEIIVEPVEPKKEGYRFIGWTPEVPDTMPAENLTFTATWSANSYDALFDANGGKWTDGTEEKTVSTVFDSQIVAPEMPTKQGYVFSTWSPEVGIMDDVNGKTFVAEWIPATDTHYTVETYTMNTLGEYEKTAQTFGGTTNTTVNAEYEIGTGYFLNTEKSVISGTVAADNSLVLKVYIDRNTYTFTTVVDGVSTETKYLYGSMVSEPVTPTKAEYKFIKWDGAIPETMPAENVTVTAVFEKLYICPECGNEILGEDAINEHIASETRVTISDGVVVTSGEMKPGATITVSAPQVDGKIFSHWTVNGATVENTESIEATIVLGSGKISITAEYDDCECKCHQGGIEGFFFRIVLFFQKLFGNNLECYCGTKH